MTEDGVRPAPDAGALAGRARGRHIVIDANRSWSCGAWIGGVVARWAIDDRDAGPVDGFTELAPVDGVRVVARSSVVELLAMAGASVRPGGRFRRDSLVVWLDHPELLLDWLANPRLSWKAPAASAEADRLDG